MPFDAMPQACDDNIRGLREVDPQPSSILAAFCLLLLTLIMAAAQVVKASVMRQKTETKLWTAQKDHEYALTVKVPRKPSCRNARPCKRSCTVCLSEQSNE